MWLLQDIDSYPCHDYNDARYALLEKMMEANTNTILETVRDKIAECVGKGVNNLLETNPSLGSPMLEFSPCDDFETCLPLGLMLKRKHLWPTLEQ